MTEKNEQRVELAQDVFWLFRKATVSATGCWEGRGKRNRYSTIRLNGRAQTGHRVAWRVAFGEIPRRMYVCHKCNNKRCFNPAHLYLGTPSDNLLDAWKDGLRVQNRTNCLHGPTKANAEKTECKYGHPLSGSNLYMTSRGYRHCRACANRQQKEYFARKQAATIKAMGGENGR